MSVNMVNTRHNKEQGTEEKANNQKNVPVTEIDLETPEQSIDGMERKLTESTPMPNVEDQETKTVEISPIGNGDEITYNTPETKKDDSQAKITSFTEWFTAMIEMKPREKEEMTTATEKSKSLWYGFHDNHRS